MPVLLDTERFAAAIAQRGVNCLTIGLVNNMPDAAVAASERQFLDLMRAATPDTVVRLKLFSIPAVPRTAPMRSEFAQRYGTISELWRTRLDGLIVTGNEPRAGNLADEPYWPDLRSLVEWAQDNTASAIWSCLAAHAAVLCADGIERMPLKEKLFGVFDCEVVESHLLLGGLGQMLRVPHSRHNTLSDAALIASGYRILTRCNEIGADMFVRKQEGRSLFVFLQGHPEYEATTLAREFRRDVARFLRGEREHYPAIPREYFNERAAEIADAFRARAVSERNERLIADFPMAAIEAGVENTWRAAAVTMYRNWIGYLKDRRVERRAPIVPVRRSRRDMPRTASSEPSARRRSAR